MDRRHSSKSRSSSSHRDAPLGKDYAQRDYYGTGTTEHGATVFKYKQNNGKFAWSYGYNDDGFLEWVENGVIVGPQEKVRDKAGQKAYAEEKHHAAKYQPVLDENRRNRITMI